MKNPIELSSNILTDPHHTILQTLNSKCKSIGIVIEQGFGARIFLQTRILESLTKSGLNPVILTTGPQSIRKYLDNKGMQNIQVHEFKTEEYKELRNSFFYNLFKYIRLFALKTRTSRDFLKIERKDAFANNNINRKIFFILISGMVQLAKLHPVFMYWIIKLENTIFRTNSNYDFFKSHNPIALVTSSIGTFDHDAFILREAKLHNIPTISYVLSWDNTSVRGYGVNLSDKILSWSKVMQDELINLHNIDKSIITTVGVPHYDAYQDTLWSKEELYSSMDIPLDKKLIFFGTKSPNTFKANMDIASTITKWITTDPNLRDYVLVCRLHPIYFVNNRDKTGLHFDEDWESLQQQLTSNILTIDYPEIIDGDLNYFMTDTEIPKLGSILKYSDITINMFSTLNLEASIFDKPTINIAFDNTKTEIKGYKQNRFNIKVDEMQTHNQRVINSGATQVVHSYAELHSSILSALKNPSCKSEARKNLVENECSTHIGKSSDIIATTIINFCES